MIEIEYRLSMFWSSASNLLRRNERNLSGGIEQTESLTEMLANIRSCHPAHADFARGEIAREAARLNRRNQRLQRVSVRFQCAVRLRQESGNDTRQRVSRSCCAQTRSTSWIHEDTAIERSDQCSRTLQYQYYLM